MWGNTITGGCYFLWNGNYDSLRGRVIALPLIFIFSCGKRCQGDCANCANKMEAAAQKTDGVKNAVVNFMTLKMNVEFEEGQDPKSVMEEVRKNCKKVESDCEIFL